MAAVIPGRRDGVVLYTARCLLQPSMAIPRAEAHKPIAEAAGEREAVQGGQIAGCPQDTDSEVDFGHAAGALAVCPGSSRCTGARDVLTRSFLLSPLSVSAVFLSPLGLQRRAGRAEGERTMVLGLAPLNIPLGRGSGTSFDLVGRHGKRTLRHEFA